MKSNFTRIIVFTILLCFLQYFSNAQTTHYVDSSVAVSGDGSSWATAFKDLQQAIGSSSANDTVLVARGTYQRDAGQNYIVYVSGIKIFGGFPTGGGTFAQRNVFNNPTILKGSANANTVVSLGATPGNYVDFGNMEFDGFTIRDGAPNSYVVFGAGMQVVYAHPIIRNCTFTNNNANYAYDPPGYASGFGTGGALYVDAYQETGSPVLINCAFYNNTAGKGGAIYVEGSGGLIAINCSFSNNGSILYGGTISIWTSNLADHFSAYNCIFDNTINRDLSNGGTQWPVLQNCIYPNNYDQMAATGTGNIVDVPGFVDPNNGNLHLQCNSPANNAGSNTWLPGYLTTDIAGNARIQNGIVDIGAFEAAGGTRNTVVNVNLCRGNTYTFNGQSLTDPGTYFNTLHTWYGCDSIITLNLAVVDATTSTTNITAIASYTWNGSTYASSGSHVWHGINAVGCDSTATLNLTIVNVGSCIYVDSSVVSSGDGNSWVSPFKTLSEAFAAANAVGSPVDSILVAKGTYYPTGAQTGTGRDAAFVIRQTGGIQLYGGYPNGGGTRNITAYPAILSGDIGVANDAGDNSYHVLLIAGLPATADSTIIDGFTIRDGNANNISSNVPTINGQPIWGYNGGAIFTKTAYNTTAAVAIRNCTFRDNYALYGGGIYNENCSPVITHCSFVDNIADIGGGGIYNYYASPLVIGCSFINNEAHPYYMGYGYGAGIYNQYGSPIISNCVFSGNRATDAYGSGGNEYGGGIANDAGAAATITNCIFSGNITTDQVWYSPCYGGGIANINQGTAIISNCTFWNNTSDGGTIYYDASSYYTPPVITNCIVYGNSTGITDDAVTYGFPASNVAAVTYSLVQGGYTGTGNSDADPLFLNAANPIGADGIWGTADDGLRVQPGSPAINAGKADTTGLGIGHTTDMLQRSRIQNNIADVGAYELTAYYSTGSNTANTLANWKTNTDGTGTSPAAFAEMARYTVQAGHTLSLSGNLGLDSGALFIQAGAAINNTGTLSVGNVLSNNNAITGTGSVVLKGSMGTPNILSGVGTISNVTINNNSGVTISSTATAQTLTGVLNPQAGVLTTNGNLMLASNATGTAAIAAIDGITNTGSFNGTIQVQRYLTAQRAYRLLGHPFNSNVALSNVQPYVDITGSGAGLTAGNASAFNYTTGNWAGYSNNADTWNKNEALFLFVRGTPGQGIGAASGGYTPNPVTLQLAGPVNTGNLDYTVKAASSFSGAEAQGWNAIGNPYPAPIDVNSIGNISAVGGTGASIYLWNAGKQSTAAGVASGGYDYYTLGSPILIPMYGAFFINNTSGIDQTIHFTENNKQLGTPLSLFGGTVQQGFELMVYDTANNYWDKLKVSFNTAATTAATDNEDLVKMSNTSLDFYSISSDAKKLAINRQPALQTTTALIPLGITTSVQKSFVIKAGMVNIPAYANYYLHDRYMEQWIPITDGMNYSFAINADTASKGNNRFEVLMKPNAQIINVDTNTVIAPGRLLVTATPNPVVNTLTISYASPLALPTTIRITDATGRAVYQLNAGTIQSGTIQVQAAAWSRGVYLVQVSNGKETITQKIIK